ncbi:hypothetical protein C5167_013092 [Papaver somniferum]|uniref:C2H2-type domain-containing protein n=1 Tax=Papaver somniferum TaxID=3469 RepID=A0A4Y7J2G0_PAPSO|nr:uncharacterized protein LOC113356222 [Papaver somniferum]RZC54232.1 hypothetical protein C5167_013092 [Papaver somniferum]
MPETRNYRKPTEKTHTISSQKEKSLPPLTRTETNTATATSPAASPPSWVVMRSIFSCKHDQQEEKQEAEPISTTKEGNSKRCKKMVCSGSSLCSNTKVMHRPESLSPESSKKWGSSLSASCSSSSNGSTSRRSNGVISTSSVSTTASSSSSASSAAAGTSSTTRSSGGGSFRGMQFRRLSGCYECRMVVDPSHLVSRDPSLRNTLSTCPVCGEVFMKTEDLELHQSVRHAVSELGPEDSSRNIVEIIFQSSWLKKQAPVCKIERILKVNNTQKTITRFEDYRESIKTKANKLIKKHPRCVADGNELLRFHCTTFVCSIGVNGSSNLCNSIPQCNVCSIIKNGFKIEGMTGGGGICTTATSGKAHDNAKITSQKEKRAMLVCRVIAGRVKRNQDGSGAEEFDSVAGPSGIYSDLDELSVFNYKAILPCFVVIYGGF